MRSKESYQRANRSYFAAKSLEANSTDIKKSPKYARYQFSGQR
jgi:hypothetical protein